MSPFSIFLHFAHNSHRRMSMRSISLTSMLLLAPTVIAQAHPLDSPDIVYVDGLPCNSACQSYLAWSRQALMRGRSLPVRVTRPSANPTAYRAKTASAGGPKPTALVPLPKQAVPIPAPRTELAELHPAANITPDANALRAKTDVPANFISRTLQEQVLAATALAERVTATSASLLFEKENVVGSSGQSDKPKPTDDEEAAAVSSKRIKNLVVLILARPEIKSIADLAQKDIAIEDNQLEARDQILAGIATAGATAVQLRNGNGRAIDRLVGGDEPAAVLALVSPEAADWFPEIKGFRTLRIPLSPSPVKARL